MKKVAIADDHPIIRAGLRKILERDNDIKIIAELETAAGVIEFLGENECDILTLDINLPDRNGLDIIDELLKINPALKILILSISPEERYALKSLRLGAKGYLTKDSTPAELIKAINKVSMGKKYISEELADSIAADFDGQLEKLLHKKLSERELEILVLIGEGKNVNQIAEKLFISPNTVRSYRARIMEKMNINSTAELIHYAICNKLL
ncbi:MAG: response regulator transcription factor [Ignavibacteriales bacterium]|jgi:DNA-binding NarL/FixJ family response regulator|nr:response regulator transcription factor [Ignavibacteriaceae bacterium]NLH61869.1 response regulator transcription factor [Ignavibacteriales bacterium]HOJ17928.1 response regulator transcription factor [Ignavibacteriaceae bacterium]HPO54965.1 response regulator transcription factor [Ignavibacteriaceae bacterium]